MYSLIRHFILTTAYAQSLGPKPGGLCIPFWTNGGFNAPAGSTGFTCIEEYIMFITYVFIGATASLALIMLIINGFRYMIGPAMPGGSSDAAKKGITAALIGVAVSLLTYAIIDTVLSYVTTP